MLCRIESFARVRLVVAGVLLTGLALPSACKSDESSDTDDEDGEGGAGEGGRGGGGQSGGGAAGKSGGNGGSGGGGAGGKAEGAGGNGGQGGSMGGSGGTAGGGAGAGGAAMGGMGGMGGTPMAMDYFVYTSGGKEIEGYKFDPETAGLTSIGKEELPDGSTSYLSAHPSGATLYATNELRSPMTAVGKVRAFSIEKGTGKLTAQSTKNTSAKGTVHSSVHPSGKWIFVSNYDSPGSVQVFSLDPVTRDIGDAVDTQATGAESHQIMPDPAGKGVFVPCRGPNKVFQFLFNETTGKLTKNTPDSVDSVDPRHIAFHPSGKFAFLVNENMSTVVSFAYDAASGKLQNPKSVTLAGENAGSHIEVTPDGEFVYAGGRTTDTIYGFSINQDTGELTKITEGTQNVSDPRNFTIAPTGKHLLVANEGAGTLKVFSIASDGKLTPLAGTTATVGGVKRVIVVPVPKP